MNEATNIPNYLTDLDYTTLYFPEQSPVVMNYQARLQGWEMADITEPFTYLDMGCGNGLTCNVLAASLPNGLFYGNDFNPAHIEKARDIARRGQLNNVTFLEASFAELCDADLPQFDYITLHGIYSWVSPDVQNDILRTLKTLLKPSGIVYLSYNTLPGWGPLMAIRETMRTLTRNHPGGPLERAAEGVRILQMFDKNNSTLIRSSTKLANEIRGLSKQNLRYLAHEFLNETWQPMFFNEVADQMAATGLEYMGAAGLRAYAADVKTLANFEAFLETRSSHQEQEAAKSLILNERFRRDLYLNKRDSSIRQTPIEALSSTVIGNARTHRLNKQVSTQGLSTEGQPLIEMIFEGEHSIRQVLSDSSLKEWSPETLLAGIDHLIKEGWMRPFACPAKSSTTRADDKFKLTSPFNRMVLDDFTLSSTGCWLASPVTGDGIHLDLISRLYLLGTLEGVPDKEQDFVRQWLKQNPATPKDSIAVPPEGEKRRIYLQKKFKIYTEKLQPVLLRLGILEIV